MKRQKTQNSQHNIEEEQNCRTDTTGVHLLQSHSDHDSVVLVKEQKNRSMQQTTEPRNISIQIQQTNIYQRSKEESMENGQSFQYNAAGTARHPDAKRQKNKEKKRRRKKKRILDTDLTLFLKIN